MKIGATPVRTPEDILDALSIEKEVKNTASLVLNESEKKIIELLSEPLSRDELIRTLNMRAGDVNVLLISMELRGLIAESGGEIRKTI